jgi:hypothetical protein
MAPIWCVSLPVHFPVQLAPGEQNRSYTEPLILCTDPILLVKGGGSRCTSRAGQAWSAPSRKSDQRLRGNDLTLWWMHHNGSMPTLLGNPDHRPNLEAMGPEVAISW